MSDTPRSDAAEMDQSNFSDWGSGPSGYVGIDFAKELERELAAQVAYAERSADLLRYLRDCIGDDGYQVAGPSKVKLAEIDALLAESPQMSKENPVAPERVGRFGGGSNGADLPTDPAPNSGNQSGAAGPDTPPASEAPESPCDRDQRLAILLDDLADNAQTMTNPPPAWVALRQAAMMFRDPDVRVELQQACDTPAVDCSRTDGCRAKHNQCAEVGKCLDAVLSHGDESK